MKSARLVAKWEALGHKHFLALFEQDGVYFYNSLTSGGNFGKLPSDQIAIQRMIAPWGTKLPVGPVTMLKINYRSLKRVK